MKINTIPFLLFFVMLSQGLVAQIGIGTTNPESSANMDLVSHKKGILIPRMIETDRDNISLPAKGLLIFNTDTNRIQVNKGTQGDPSWQTLLGIKGPYATDGNGGIIQLPGLGLSCVASGLNAISFGGTYNLASGVNSSATGGTYNEVNTLNAGALGGTYNLGSGINSSIIGGSSSNATELNSSVLGGTTNKALGVNSNVIGGSTIHAENLNASAIGGTTNSSYGLNSTVIGGVTNFAYSINSGVLSGIDNRAYEINSVVVGGASNRVRGINSVSVGGTANQASGINSAVSGGTTNHTSAINSGAIAGTTNSVNGINAIIFGGSGNTANADYSVVLGGRANNSTGAYSTVLAGYGNDSNSYGELSIGINGTLIPAANPLSFEAINKILSIGNGIDIGSPSDALIVLKSGLATLPSATVLSIDAANEKIITTKEYTNATYVKYGTVAPISSSAPGVFGEIRVTPTYTYTCIAENTWRRVVTSTW